MKAVKTKVEIINEDLGSPEAALVVGTKLSAEETKRAIAALTSVVEQASNLFGSQVELTYVARTDIQSE